MKKNERKKSVLILKGDLSTTGAGRIGREEGATLDLIKWYDYEIAESIAIIGQMCMTFPLHGNKKKSRFGRPSLAVHVHLSFFA